MTLEVSRKHVLDPLAKAAAARTSNMRSLTTGLVCDEVIRCSRVSRNLRDIECCTNNSLEFQSMMAHNYADCRFKSRGKGAERELTLAADNCAVGSPYLYAYI